MKKNKNALFLQRLFAYLIDVIIVAVLAGMLSSPLINKTSTEKINKELTSVLQKYQKQEITFDTYLKEYSVLALESSKQSGIVNVFSAFVSILYFIVFQLYNKGQTLGKKILRIKVVSDSGELTMNQMIFRSLLINSILLNMITIAVISFISDSMTYFYVVGFLELLQYIFFITCLFMVMFSKEKISLHDKITKTRVVNI